MLCKLVEVSATLLPAFEAPDWVLQVIVLLLAIGFMLVLVFSWAYELTPEGVKRSNEVEAVQPVSESVPSVVAEELREVLPNSIAVLPFENLNLYPVSTSWTE